MEQIRLVFVVLLLLFSLFAVLVVPLPIKVESKSKVEDNNLQETIAHVINKKSLDEEGNNAYESTLDDPETTMSESNLRLRLFPEIPTPDSDSQLETRVEPSPKTPVLLFFLTPQELDKQGQQGEVDNEGETKNDTDDDSENGDDDDIGDYEESPKGDKKGDDPDPRSNNVKIGGGTPPTIPTEKTVLVPKYKTDYLGNWVYNPWGVTYGQMFQDTRFVGNIKWSDDNIYMDKHTMLYNPRNEVKNKVCRRESTGYNALFVTQFLELPFYHFEQTKIHILPDLRKEIYEKGKSEECHTPKQINWRTFNECQMMRHMRMEYLVPYYPMIQTHQDWDYDRYYNHRWPLDNNPVWWYNAERYTPRFGDPTK